MMSENIPLKIGVKNNRNPPHEFFQLGVLMKNRWQQIVHRPTITSNQILL